MINKVIHYCWFGGNPLDDKAKRCLESWKKFFPDYEIIQWNENNFDVTTIDFMNKAYQNQKWAFVSDVARLLIIYEHGGIYFDTDVEVIRSFDDIINDNTKAFLGMEYGAIVNSGLGFGAEKNHPFVKRSIEIYKYINFDEYKDNLSDISCPILTTRLLEEKGFIREDIKQTIEEIEIYPKSFFSPMDYRTGKLSVTNETHSIHWYNASWQDDREKQEQERLRKLSAIIGTKNADIIYGITACIRNEGLIQYILKRIKKYLIER